jgi:hypothetical protein
MRRQGDKETGRWGGQVRSAEFGIRNGAGGAGGANPALTGVRLFHVGPLGLRQLFSTPAAIAVFFWFRAPNPGCYPGL